MSTKGIIYIAIGESHLKLAINSAISIIKTGYNDKFLILTDVELKHTLKNCQIEFKDIGEITNSIAELSPDRIVAYLKTRLYKYSPFSQTLYLDNDIRAVRCIDPIWNRADNWIGFAPAYNPLTLSCEYPKYLEELATAHLLTDSDLLQYNSGMFLFGKSPELVTFFDSWFKEWLRFKKHENMALTRMLKRKNICVAPIPSIYNQFYPDKTDDSVLVHYIDWYKRYLD